MYEDMKKEEVVMMLQIIKKEAHVSPKRLFHLLNIEHFQPMWETFDEFFVFSNNVNRIVLFLLAHPKISEESKARVRQLLKERVSSIGLQDIVSNIEIFNQYLSFLPPICFNWKVRRYYR